MTSKLKENRLRCQQACQKYWDCLQQVEQNGKHADRKCDELKIVYMNICPEEWIKHFNKKWSYLQLKDKIEKDGIPDLTENDIKGKQKRRVYMDIVI